MLSFPITPAALRWLETILAERFGLAWRLARTEEGLELSLVGAEGAIVFDTSCDGFTQASSDLAFSQWDAEDEGWSSVLGGPLPAPGLAELASPLIEQNKEKTYIHYDILGLAYWMMARVEEIGRIELDSHGRFPATSSHAFKHGYLNQPVIDEWLYILGNVIQRTWPDITIKANRYSVRLSHDVDRPYNYYFMDWLSLAKQLLGDVVKRKDLVLAYKRFSTWQQIRKGDLDADPYNTFDWLMDISENNGIKSCFYFMCGQTNQKYDSDYEVTHPVISNLLRSIISRGHEIGIHPSYGCLGNSKSIAKELDHLRQACENVGLENMKFGSRMHYLRWKHPETMLALDKVMLSYDSTLIFPDRVGFRCGTCYSYPAFDALNDRQLSLRIIPLIVMDQLLLAECPAGDDEALIERVSDIGRKVAAVGGTLTILWHNSSLVGYKSLYSRLVSAAVTMGEKETRNGKYAGAVAI
jgi:hypothetical protein